MTSTASTLSQTRAIIAWVASISHDGEGLIFAHGLTPERSSAAINMLELHCVVCHGDWETCGCGPDELADHGGAEFAFDQQIGMLQAFQPDVEVCEHGLSAWLCDDPINHWSDHGRRF